MLDKKFKISVGAIIAAMLSFTILPGQANNLFIEEKNSCREILLAEAMVEYPFGWFYTFELIKLRNIIGWYDGESIEVVTAHQNELVGSGKSNIATIPQGLRGVGSITFKANINGEFSIKHADQIIRLDISLWDYYYY